MVPSILSLSEVVAVVELLEGDLGMSIFYRWRDFLREIFRFNRKKKKLTDFRLLQFLFQVVRTQCVHPTPVLTASGILGK